MFESFGRGFRMIWASIKMGWQDKRLLLPSILTVFTNLIFGTLLVLQGMERVQHPAAPGATGMPGMPGMTGMPGMGAPAMPTHGLLQHGQHQIGQIVGMTGLNGPLDQSGFSALSGFANTESMIVFGSLMAMWWLTNRFLEGVTTALVYTHLTEGSGSGKFGQACSAVLSSLPALAMLGIATFIAKKLAGWLRDRKGSGVFGFGFSFLASVVEVFWTLAGHLILPAIVIEGTSFVGGLKRADKIAQGNLITIGVGEVGVDAICKGFSYLVYLAGMGGFGYAYYIHMPFTAPIVVIGGLLWAALVVLVTAMSIYIRAAFYTCLYAWAIDAEAVQATERVRVKPPEALAAALA
jgi:hypothetical protein